MNSKFEEGSEFPKSLDNNDKLGHFRNRFYLKKGTLYMCGNSLGLASKDAEDAILELLQHWKLEGVKIWNFKNCKYLQYSAYLAKLMAPLVGADPDEIAVTEVTTTNIHITVSTFYKPTKKRYKIVVDDINFPTDKYAIDGQVRLKGLEPKDAVKVVKSREKYIHEDDVIQAMTDDVAMVFLPLVYYRTAQILDIKKITTAAKERGICIGWDLCHGIGAIEIDLKSVDADFAVWCNYKYLNGGPGATSALYINRKHFNKMPGLPGWYGNKVETKFMLKQEFEKQKDASGWQVGSPNLLSMAGLEGSLRIHLEAGMENIRRKSLHITAYLIFLCEKVLFKYGFSIGTLKEDGRRGGHVCLENDEAYRISVALKKRGVVGDYRDPNIIRLTPTALYTSYQEVYDLVQIVKDIMENKTYEQVSHQRDLVV